LLFHRTLGKFHYKQEGNYCVGTVGYQDVDCEFIDLTYVRCSSQELDKMVHKKASAFSECLRSREHETQGQSRSGHISLTFYQIKKARWPFPSESIPWEVWTLRMEIVSLASSNERQLYREKVGELQAEKILFIAESMNRSTYVPKMPNQPELELIFDTSFIDIQPYLFEISYGTSPPSAGASMGTTVRRLLKDTLSLG